MQFLEAPYQPSPLFEQLLTIASETPIVDNHAHPFYVESPTAAQPYTLPLLRHILTGSTPPAPDAPPPDPAPASNSLCYSRSLFDMHRLLHTRLKLPPSPTQSSNQPPKQHLIENAVEKTRQDLGPVSLARHCFRVSNIASVLIDDGLSTPPNARPFGVSDFQTHLNLPLSRRVLRLEVCAESLLNNMISNKKLSIPTSSEFDSSVPNASAFRSAFRSTIDPLPPNVVSFKTIAAYRSSLSIDTQTPDSQLEQALRKLISIHQSTAKPIRLTNPVIIDVVVTEGLRVADLYGIPIQVHCGFGDTDVDILNANPALLRPVFLAFPRVKVVLLHAAWPYTREAAYLTSCYPGVYVDFGLVVPLLSIRGMFKAIDQLLEIAPLDKILYSSDAHTTPDAFYLSAMWGRRVLSAVLAGSVVSGDLTAEQAWTAVSDILSNNAIRIYDIPMQPHRPLISQPT